MGIVNDRSGISERSVRKIQDMKTSIDQFIFDLKDGMSAEVLSTESRDGVTIATIRFTWTEENAAKDERVRMEFHRPDVGMLYAWAPLYKERHHVGAEWTTMENSMISRNAPVYALYDGRGMNRLTWQISECRMTMYFLSGVEELDGVMRNRLDFYVQQFTNQLETEITVRIDERCLPLYEVLKEAAVWWESIGMTPAEVPEEALKPCYSFWYSYHQEVYAADVEAECRRARELGFESCIIDDGWQTDDTNRGYAFCGDWEVAAAKIPDMAAHVKAVHDIGMKYILWYAVPLIGFKSSKYQEFKDMVLNKKDLHMANLDCAVLDPRYKEVRDFLISIYVKALKEWDLDGFKLDFIDTWQFNPDHEPAKPEMDIASLETAATVFMQDLNAALKAVKPEVMLEFRQGYIGPWMRTVGNMFRVSDCPDDYISNRLGVFDLRMMMGKSAVHSDMLMWHPEEEPSTAALQLISVLYGVIQYSARLEKLTPEMKKMSIFWLDFAREHKAALLGDTLKVYEPHMNYTWAQAATDTENVAAVYGQDKVIQPDIRDTVYIANGAMNDRILAEITGTFQVTIQNCMGDILSETEQTMNGLTVLSVPTGGLVTLKK